MASPPKGGEEPGEEEKAPGSAVEDLGSVGGDTSLRGARGLSAFSPGAISGPKTSGRGAANALKKAEEGAAAEGGLRVGVPGGSQVGPAAVPRAGWEASLVTHGGGSAPAAAAAAELSTGSEALFVTPGGGSEPPVAAAVLSTLENAPHPRRIMASTVKLAARSTAAAATAAGRENGVTAAAADAPPASGAAMFYVAGLGAPAPCPSKVLGVSKPAAMSVAADIGRRQQGRAASSTGERGVARVAAAGGGTAAVTQSRSPAAAGSVAGALGRVQEEFVCPITQVGMLARFWGFWNIANER